MSNIMISFFLAAGVAGWGYAQLARRNGNASPKNNALAAGVGGLVAGIVFFTFLKFILNIH